MSRPGRTAAGWTALCSAALLSYSLYHQYTDRNIAGWKTSPYLFPVLLSVFGFLLVPALLREGAPAAGGGRRAPLLVLGLTAAYCLLLPLLRFLPATALYLGALFHLLGERGWRKIAALSLGTALAVYALFGLGLNVRLP